MPEHDGPCIDVDPYVPTGVCQLCLDIETAETAEELPHEETTE